MVTDQLCESRWVAPRTSASFSSPSSVELGVGSHAICHPTTTHSCTPSRAPAGSGLIPARTSWPRGRCADAPSTAATASR